MGKDIKAKIKHMKVAIIVTIIIILIVSISIRVFINTRPTIAGGRIWDSIYIEIDKPNGNYKVTFSVENLKSEDELVEFRNEFNQIKEDISNDGKKIYKIDVFSEYRNNVKIYVYKDEMLINSFNFNKVVKNVPGRRYDYHFIYQTETQQLVDKDKLEMNGKAIIELPEYFGAYLIQCLIFIVLIIEIVVYIKLKKSFKNQ